MGNQRIKMHVEVEDELDDPERERSQEQKLQDDYRQALKLGEVLVAYARVMMVGPGGVGKSSFLRGLMNQRLVQSAESTILADTKTVKLQFWAKAGESADSYWVEVTEEDEIQELAGLVQLVTLVKSTPSHTAKILSTVATAAAVGVFKPPGFTPQGVQTTQDEYVSNIKDDVVRHVLQQALECTQSTPQAENFAVPQSDVLMHVWDCGGQPVFLDVLPAFLTSRTMFLLFFDAQQNLLDQCSSLSYRAGRVVSKSEQNFTTLQLLTQWMASIHAMLTRKDRLVGAIPEASTAPMEIESPAAVVRGTQFSNSIVQLSSGTNVRGDTIPKFPRIIPVGTHGDDPQVKIKRAEILSTLLSQCENKAYTPLLLDGLIVDNTTAGHGKEAEDRGFKYIREKVHHLASKHLAVRTPVAWVLFRKVLQKVAKGRPIVSYQQAVAVGEACGMAEDVVPSVLHFYHELAVLFHYTRIESLSNHVIADPQWLIKQLGKLLAPEGLEQEVSNQLLWKPLRENGILVQPLYEDVWEESYQKYNIKPQSLADLLEHFILAAPIDPPESLSPFTASNPCRKYFVPSVLQLSSQDIDSTSKSTEIVKMSAPVYLTFSTRYVPPGFFTRLATTLTKESKCEPFFERGVFRNKMTFVYGEPGRKIDEFTILEQSSSVQINVVRIKHRRSHMTFGNACCDIIKLVQACSATVCQWLPSVKVEITFPCDKCPDKNHFITIPPGAETDSDLLCEAGKFCNLTKERQYWLKIPSSPKLLAWKGGLSDAELKGVAIDVQESGKLKCLADELEMVHQFESLEHDVDAPLTLLYRWRSEIENGLEAHSLLVYHLRCIGLNRTSHRLLYREFLPFPNRTTFSAEEPLSLAHMIACSRCIDGNLNVLATALHIPDEEVKTIKSKFKTAQTSYQAFHLLKKWQSFGTHTKQELAEVLQGAGFPQAKEILMMTSLEKASTTQREPHLRELISYVHTTEWYGLGLQLDVDIFKLSQIGKDARENQEHLRLMFEAWLQVSENPSWQDVVQALKAIGERRLAVKLEQKFCK